MFWMIVRCNGDDRPQYGEHGDIQAAFVDRAKALAHARRLNTPWRYPGCRVRPFRIRTMRTTN